MKTRSLCCCELGSVPFGNCLFSFLEQRGTSRLARVSFWRRPAYFVRAVCCSFSFSSVVVVGRLISVWDRVGFLADTGGRPVGSRMIRLPFCRLLFYLQSKIKPNNIWVTRPPEWLWPYGSFLLLLGREFFPDRHFWPSSDWQLLFSVVLTDEPIQCQCNHSLWAFLWNPIKLDCPVDIETDETKKKVLF